MKRTALFMLCLMLPVTAFAEVCSNCQVTVRKRNAYNVLLQLSSQERSKSTATHLPFGIPQTPGATNEILLHNEHYIINYDTDLKVPIWVAHRLRDSDVVATDRLNCFRTDIRLPDPDDSPSCDDYAGSGFDRGHLVPRADMNRSEAAMINTFMFTNMAPQIGEDFNRDLWAHFERRVRKWAKDRREIYVISGSIFDRDGDGVRDADDDPNKEVTEPGSEVAVPSHFFKIVITDKPNEDIDAIAVILPHQVFTFSDNTLGMRDAELESHIETIREIEEMTGINFNPDVPDSIANVFETTPATDLW